MTYSIIARDRQSGQIGIAVASRFFAVGAAVPYVRANCAVATQSYVNPLWALEGLERMKDGTPGEDLLQEFRTRDTGAGYRQVHMLDTNGEFCAHTGDECLEWAGHLIGANVSVAGNLLAGEEVLASMHEAFETNGALPMPERLLACLVAGEAAGGDRRGRQSAALIVHNGQDYPAIDIRSDDHPDPLSELGRLITVAYEDYMPFSAGMPTAQDFSCTDNVVMTGRLN